VDGKRACINKTFSNQHLTDSMHDQSETLRTTYFPLPDINENILHGTFDLIAGCHVTIVQLTVVSNFS